MILTNRVKRFLRKPRTTRESTPKLPSDGPSLQGLGVLLDRSHTNWMAAALLHSFGRCPSCHAVGYNPPPHQRLWSFTPRAPSGVSKMRGNLPTYTSKQVVTRPRVSKRTPMVTAAGSLLSTAQR